MVDKKVVVQLVAPGIVKDANTIANSVLKVANTFDVVVTAVQRISSKTGRPLKSFDVAVEKTLASGKKLQKTFISTVANTDAFVKKVETRAAALQRESKALKENATAQTIANRARGAKGAVTQKTGQLRRRDRGPATRDESGAFERSVDTLKKVAVQAKATKGQVEKIFGDIAQGQIKDYGLDLNLVRDKTIQVFGASERLGATFAKTGVAAEKAGAKAKTASDLAFKAELKRIQGTFDADARIRASGQKLAVDRLKAETKIVDATIVSNLKREQSAFKADSRIQASANKIILTRQKAAAKATDAAIVSDLKRQKSAFTADSKIQASAQKIILTRQKAAAKAADAAIVSDLKRQKSAFTADSKIQASAQKIILTRQKASAKAADAAIVSDLKRQKSAFTADSKIQASAQKIILTRQKASAKAADAAIVSNLKRAKAALDADHAIRVSAQKVEVTRLKAEAKAADAAIVSDLKRVKSAFDADARIKASSEKAATAQIEASRKVAAARVASANIGRQSRATRGEPRAAKANILEKSAVAQAEANIRKLVKTTKLSGQQINKVFADVNNGQIRSYEGSLARLQTGVIKLRKAQAGLGAAAESAHNRAAKAAKRQQAALDKTKAKTNGLVSSLKGLASIAGVSLFIGGLFQLQQALVDGAEAAIELSKKLAEIRTIQGENGLASEQWSKQLTELSDAFGIPVIEQAEAAYQTLSNQVAKGADTFLFLESANKLAVAAVTDTATSVNLLTSVINAFELSTLEAEDIAGKLFKTVELGRVRIDEMAETLGRIAVPAAKLGIRFEELLATIAVTTRQGIRFNEASTLMRGIILKLVKPTADMTKLFNKIGFASAEAAIRTLGLAGVLGEIDKAAQGSSTALAKLFNRVRGTTGALIFAGEGLNKLKDALRDIDASGVEALAKASDLVANSLGKRVEIEITKINNLFKNLGQDALEIFLELNEAVGGFSNVLKDVSKEVITVLKATITLGKFLGKISNLLDEIGLKEIPQGTKDVLNLGLAFASLLDEGEGVAKAVRNLNDEIDKLASESSQKRRKEELAFTQESLKELKKRNQGFFDSIQKRQKVLFASNDNRLKADVDLTRRADAANSQLVNGIKDLARIADTEYKKLSKGAEATAKDISKSFISAGKGLFDFDISIAVDKTQIALIDNELIRARAEQEAAVASGDKKTFERRTAQIKSLQKQRFAVVSKVAKAQRIADRSTTDAKIELLRAQASGDKDRETAARNALKDAKNAQQQVGSISSEELDIQQKIVDVRRKLRKAGPTSNVKKELRTELRGLQEAQASIASQGIEEDSQRKAFEESFTSEQSQRKTLQTELDDQAKSALKERNGLRRLSAELIDLDKRRRAFDLAKELKGEDLGDVKTSFQKQEDVISKTIELQKKLDIGADRISLENELQNIREAGITRISQLELKLQGDIARKNEQEVTRRAKALDAAGEKRIQAIEEINKLSTRVLTAAAATRSASSAEFGAQTGLSGTPARKAQANLVVALEETGKLLAKEAQTPGSVDAGLLARAVALTEKVLSETDRVRVVTLERDVLDSLVRTRSPDLPPARPLASDRVGTLVGRALKEFGVALSDQRKAALDFIKGGKGREEKLTASNKLLSGIQESLAKGTFSDILKRSRQSSDDLVSLLKEAKNRTADSVLSPTQAAGTSPAQTGVAIAKGMTDQTIENGVKAAEAQHDIMVHTAIDAAIAAEEAREKLSKQREEQAKIAKTAKGLTGRARQVALQDAGIGQATGGAALRKQQAEARRDQGKRNNQFFIDRQNRKAQERGDTLPTTTEATGDKTLASAIAQLNTQIEQARSIEGPDSQKAARLSTALADLVAQQQTKPVGSEAFATKKEEPVLEEKNTTAVVSLTSSLDKLRSIFESLPFLRLAGPIIPIPEDPAQTPDGPTPRGAPTGTTLATAVESFSALVKEIKSSFRDPFASPQPRPTMSEAQFAATQATNRDFSPDLSINPQVLPRAPRMPDFSLSDPTLSLDTITIENNIQLDIDGKQAAVTLQPHINRLNARSNRQNTNPANRQRGNR